MDDYNFHKPQRQSLVGVLLIFFKVVYQLFRIFWALLFIYFFKESSELLPDYAKLGLVVLFLLIMGYSYWYYYNFLFYIDEEKEAFILQKGVFGSDEIEVSFDKIQQVNLKRSLLQRAIGVYSVVIDTAGSKEKEIEIKAISEGKANAIANYLLELKRKKETDSSESGMAQKEKVHAEPENSTWVHRLSFIDLLKIGLTNSYLRGFVLIIAFLSTAYNELQELYQENLNQVENYSKGYFTNFSENIFLFSLLFLAVVVLSMLVTTGEVFLKYFNLKLEQTRNSLILEMGLKTNTKYVLQPRRVQCLRISTNPIQKKLNLYEAQFLLASSTDHINKSKIKVPGLRSGILEEIKSFLYDNIPRDTEIFKPAKAWLFRRCLLGLIPIPLVLMALRNSSLFYFWGSWAIIFSYLFLMILYHWFSYQVIQLEVNSTFIVKTHGLWTRKQEIMEIYKLEGITVKQPVWYQSRKLHNLVFHTAGGDISLRAVSENILPQLNYFLYTVETSKKAWM